PLAEQSGLILEIGDWVVEEACRTLAERKSNPHLIDVPLSINVSEYQLRVGTFVDKVKAALLKYGLRPSMLCIEVTETLLHVDIDRSIAQLEQLRELGVKISLDDFGTGFSSLSYLQRLPVHEVKIDRSFIAALEHDDGQMKFVQGIVKLAHIMGLSTVAEGVENEAQFQRLRSMGADRFQGFAFGKPEPV
ncbi:EAL domain-containing protein, partial [Gordonia sp. (in: high G+C Gram-positive bacteria)]|uniref:EAL domain-containing protein n=1 Tax=Gordonia sp. (in: high G+C Gram-positive bacteria) TaxID=84139 RepID=UPI0016B231B8